MQGNSDDDYEDDVCMVEQLKLHKLNLSSNTYNYFHINTITLENGSSIEMFPLVPFL
jgi:hypothetical protein